MASRWRKFFLNSRSRPFIWHVLGLNEKNILIPTYIEKTGSVMKRWRGPEKGRCIRPLHVTHARCAPITLSSLALAGFSSPSPASGPIILLHRAKDAEERASTRGVLGTCLALPVDEQARRDKGRTREGRAGERRAAGRGPGWGRVGAAGDHGEIFLILVLSPPSPSVTLTIRSPSVDEQVGRDRRGKDERANVAGDRGGGGSRTW